MKGPVTRLVIMHALAQRRSAIVMEEAMIEMHRGSNMGKRSPTCLIHRGRRWIRCTQKMDGEGVRLEIHWSYRELEEINEEEIRRESNAREGESLQGRKREERIL